MLNLSVPDSDICVHSVSEICKYLGFVSLISVIFIHFSFRIIPVGFCDVSSFFLSTDQIVSSPIFRNISNLLRNEPSTPERDRTAEREHSRIQRLNMTSTDERRSRNCSGTPLQGVPVPQPVFMGADQSVPLRHSVPAASTVAGQYPQAGYAGPASTLPPPVPGDVFGVGTRHIAPMQNAHAGPSHLGPFQMLPQPQPHMNLPPQNPWRVDSMPAPMPPPQYPPQQSEFINLGDDIPQGQMGSGWNPSSSAVPSHHRTIRPVQSNPAFHNIHRGHIAHREREAAHRQSLLDQEFLSLHQVERDTRQWVISDEQDRHARNKNRRRMHLPEEPPPQLHMDMSREHAWRQQRIATEKQQLKESRMSICHSRLNSFEENKKLKERLFTESRKRETI